MHTPTCRHTHTHKHFRVIVLEFMGHLKYRHTLYVWIQDVLIQKGDRLCFQLLDGIRDNVKRNLPEDVIYRERLPQCRGNCCAPVQTFRPRETGKERGGEEEKLPFSCSFPPNPPCSFQEWPPLSLDKIQEETRSHPAKGIREKCLYRVLIL